MADDWDAFGTSQDDDGFPGSSRDDDGFPVDGNDVFGANVENVDVWGGHDSFDGDQEWFNFNGDDGDGFDGHDEDDYQDGDSDPGSPGSPDGRSNDRHRSRGSRSSNRDGGDHRGRRSSSRDRSQDRSGGSRRRSSSRDRSGDGHRRHDDAKRGRRPKPLKNDPSRSSSGRKSSSSSKSKDGGGVDENGFPAFDDNDRHDGGRTQKLRASKSGSRRHLGGVRTDDALASSYTSSSKRQSGATGSRTLIRRRDGTVTRPRPSESGSHHSRSDERRDKVRDAMFGAIGEEGNQKGGVSLGNFLVKDEKGGKPPRGSSGSVHSAPAVVSKGRRRHGGGSDRRSSGGGTGGSHHSRGSHHDRDGSSSHHGSPTKRDSRGHKNRRWSNRMEPPPEEEAESPLKAVEGAMEGLKVDIAALAEAGCIEVQDGKMRLVIDLDT